MTNRRILKSEIIIKSPSRLHLGFYGIPESYGYTYGSMGLAIDYAPVILSIKNSSKFKTNLPKKYTSSVLKYLETIKTKPKIELTALSMPDSHIGLGSGTQITLSVISAINKFFSLNLSYDEILKISSRGLRSGTGIASFKKGGFIVDACKSGDKIPKTLLQTKLPKSWRLILVNDKKSRGQFGKSELDFFNKTKKQKSLFNELPNIVLRGILPSVLYDEFDKFTIAFNEFQNLTSRYYSPKQSSPFVSKDINIVMNYIQKEHNVAVGQSSWGPLSYIFTNSLDNAKKIRNILEKNYCNYKNLTYTIVRPSNTGHTFKYNI